MLGKPAGIPKSFRPVILLSVVRKILTALLTKKITPSMQNYVRDTQSGFRAKHSTADGVFYTRMMCERSLLGVWSYSDASLDFSGVVRNDLKPFNISPLEAMSLACDKTAWLHIIESSSSKTYCVIR